MATVAVLPPSDLPIEYAAETVPAEPTDKEKLEFLEKAIKDLGEPGNVEIFREAMKELGVRAVQTDEAFARVKDTMDRFVKDHGVDFPGIVPFQKEWDGYATVRWYSDFFLVANDDTISRIGRHISLPHGTLRLKPLRNMKVRFCPFLLSTHLDSFLWNSDYTLILSQVPALITKEEMNLLAVDLKEFAVRLYPACVSFSF
jgi:hypothetical protein